MTQKITHIIEKDRHGHVKNDVPITVPITSEEGDSELLAMSQKGASDIAAATRDKITDLVVVDRDGTSHSKTHTDPETGEKVAVLQADEIGKIDGVKVNGEELPVDDNGKVDITIPQSVTDLGDADEYATKEDAQAMVDEAKITTATATSDNTSGTPRVVPIISGQDIHFDFYGIKGEKGNDGDTVILNTDPSDPTEPDHYKLYSELGGNNDGALTQKAASELIDENSNLISDIATKERTANLFDKNEATLGKYLKKDTYEETTNSNYFITDYIPISTAGLYCDVSYSSAIAIRHVVYNSEKEPIRQFNSKGIAYSEGDAYVRFTGNMSEIDTFMVVAGDSSAYPSEYVRYGYKATIKSDFLAPINQQIASIGEEVEELKSVESIVTSKVLADYSGLAKDELVFVTLQDISVPKGVTIRISSKGVGKAFEKYSYRLYGDSQSGEPKYDVTSDTPVVIVTDKICTYIRVWSTSGYRINGDENFEVKVEVVSELDQLKDSVAALEQRNVGIQDFNTAFVVSNYATDQENGEFAESFSFNVTPEASANMNVIISSFAKFVNEVDDDVPNIQFKYQKGSTTIYTSTPYTIGSKDGYVQKDWRIPRFFDGVTLNVTVTIPSNVTLYIKEISNRYSNETTMQSVGYRMNAHLGIFGGGFNSMRSFVESAKLGYPCCICVPKRTNDRVWVCFHNDDHIENALKDDNNNTPADNYSGTIGSNGLHISDLDYDQLQIYHYKTSSFDGVYEKVPTLEDFFAVCAKTGMHPMFSWHPVQSNTDIIGEVKDLAEKFGLLPYLNIKIPFSNTPDSSNALNRLYNVFGNDIESYTGDLNTDDNISDVINRLKDTNAGDNKDKVRVGIEIFNAKVTEEKVAAILQAGYFAAIAWMTTDPTGKQMEYWLKQGVTEFTEYNMMSYGLNW